MKRLLQQIPVSALLITLLISAPSVLAADHVHQNYVEEVACDFCHQSNQDDALTELPRQDCVTHKPEPTSRILTDAIEPTQLNRNARAPPKLLR